MPLRRLSKKSALLLTTAISATSLLLFITTDIEKSAPQQLPRTANVAFNHAAANDDDTAKHAHTSSWRRRSNCQIIYVLGVEGSLHHGFMPVIKALAEQQGDPVVTTTTGSQYSHNYRVVKGHEGLRAAIFGSRKQFLFANNYNNHHHLPIISDPQLVRDTLDAICPPSSQKEKHVILEGNSFPSGGFDEEEEDGNDAQLTTTTSKTTTNYYYRVRRQRSWQTMKPHEIASSPQALQHPTNLYEFYDAFSPHADVRFIVLHRPYLDTIASHAALDSGPVSHSTVISGFLLLLSRFLVSHMYSYSSAVAASALGDKDAGSSSSSGGGVPLWTIVCAEQLTSKEFETQQQLLESREAIISHLATFLGWPVQSCPQCFDNWRESSKVSPELRLGEATTNILLDHIHELEGIWPPRRIEDRLPQQQCRM